MGDLRWGDDWWGVSTINVDDGTVEADQLDVIHLTLNVGDRDRFGEGVGLRVVAFVDEPADDGFSPSEDLDAWLASIEGLAIAYDDRPTKTRTSHTPRLRSRIAAMASTEAAISCEK